MKYDLLIKAGTVVDGTGNAPFTADVGVADGKIADIGTLDPATSDRTIDADGALVLPGWVDVHTHYDGQVTWSNDLAPSSLLGTTTVVMGNCGVGFAPCRPGDREWLIGLMEGVEDIPGSALSEGLTWEWESFPEYLDAIAGRRFDIDVAAQVPHSPLRLFVMGQRAAHRPVATPEEIGQMSALVAEAVRAGALGWSTSRTRKHQSSGGEYAPTMQATDAELFGIATRMGATGTGVCQLLTDFEDGDAELDRLIEMVGRSGRPLSYTLTTGATGPLDWRHVLARTESAFKSGVPIRGQVGVRWSGVLFGLDLSMIPFTDNPVYQTIADLPLHERVAIMRKVEFRERLLRTENVGGDTSDLPYRRMATRYERMFEFGSPLNYEPPAEESLASRAQKMGCSPAELAYDLLLGDEGHAVLSLALFGYENASLDDTRELLLSEATIPALGDGGAHVGYICDASYPTFLLTHWCRDRVRGPLLELPYAVRRQTRDTAAALGLHDRGQISVGYKADINIVDFENLALRAPEMHRDLPAGGGRILQRADGILATIVSGAAVYENGVPTGLLPGRLVRGAQSAP
jgi:N-acyl-D-aspartate/D-glutamate deacylase